MPFLGLRLGNETQMSTADIQSFGKSAEESGYGEIWMTEGFGRDSLTQLTVIALATDRISLGTGILPMFSRTPLITAMSSVGLANASDGRFILGLGVGNRPATEDGHGVAYSQPVEHLSDMVHIVRALLQGEEVNHQGKAIKVNRATLGDAKPTGKIPIYLSLIHI